MSEARTFKVKTRLARQLAQGGGRLVSDAEDQAQRGLDGHTDQAMRTLAANVAALDTIATTRAEGSEPQVYVLAAALVDMAGFLDTGPFYEAAYSLCEVADAMQEAVQAGGAWSWPSVQVHVHALKLFLAVTPPGAGERRALLAGLAAVTERARASQA